MTIQRVIKDKKDYPSKHQLVTVLDEIPIWLLFLFLILFYLVLTFISNHYIYGKEIYLRSYADRFPIKSIQAFWDMKKEFWWTAYLLTPLILFLKFSFTTVCISIGAVLSSVEFKFRTVFKNVLLAESVFLAGQVIFLINISFHLNTVTLQSASNYYPLSVLSYLEVNNVVKWLRYPLQTLNFFEVAYMVIIAWLLSKKWKENIIESLAIVLPSYSTGLILWLAFVAFLTLQIS